MAKTNALHSELFEVHFVLELCYVKYEMMSNSCDPTCSMVGYVGINNMYVYMYNGV